MGEMYQDCLPTTREALLGIVWGWMNRIQSLFLRDSQRGRKIGYRDSMIGGMR